MKYKTRVFPIVLLFSTLGLGAEQKERLPDFKIADQKGKVFSSASVKGNTYFLLGCRFKDIVLCRKHGRKIYWKMQTLLKDEDRVIFSAYLDLKNAPSAVFDYILQEKEKDYESILLDKKGTLSTGLVEGKSFLRVYSPNGALIHKEYFESVDDAKVSELYKLTKSGR
ncbi:hypothetical protein [Leptospira licerasiae]|uniref:Lipoprotein n=1 Tax=Leptospira licerasiae str. MMD4847 TaxID=1049971 RepID=A0ABN0HDG7_9LEPT|nr:hypothetical protein [Leptospira licerasiae]EIE03297.1 hypothetical protein LEP1GSC185_1284 [Leptospira licerasiae serovar Varillal str. VAR 010]EJZ43681.1 hypothetical protein LEP1GSC178_3256 [Leptospira licerasiae str. MMD4847]